LENIECTELIYCHSVVPALNSSLNQAVVCVNYTRWSWYLSNHILEPIFAKISYSALKWRHNTVLFLPSSQYWWWWWSDRIIPHKKPDTHFAIKQGVLADKTWRNCFEETRWKATEIGMYIDENNSHAEFGSDSDTKNRSATGSLSRQCQKLSEDDTANRSTLQTQQTVNLWTANAFRNKC